MDELIHKKDVIDICLQYCPDDDGTCSKACGDLREMLDEIENLDTVQLEDDWVLVGDGLPEEKDSIFAKYYGTNRWKDGMFRKRSDNVLVTTILKTGNVLTEVSHTTDGRWKFGVDTIIERTVVAWKPFPKPYKQTS